MKTDSGSTIDEQEIADNINKFFASKIDTSNPKLTKILWKTP